MGLRRAPFPSVLGVEKRGKHSLSFCLCPTLKAPGAAGGLCPPLPVPRDSGSFTLQREKKEKGTSCGGHGGVLLFSQEASREPMTPAGGAFGQPGPPRRGPGLASRSPAVAEHREGCARRPSLLGVGHTRAPRAASGRSLLHPAALVFIAHRCYLSTSSCARRRTCV